MKTLRIGLIGDYNAEVPAHQAIPKALALAAEKTGPCQVEATWLPTGTLTDDAQTRLGNFDGLWCVPASPYASMDGALRAIQFARERPMPFLGTCGGFQHALIEYARNVLGLRDADHTETNPTATMPLVSLLACALVEAEGRIVLRENSRIRKIYGEAEVSEKYRCRFGFNPAYKDRLDDGRLRFTGHDREGDVRVLELEGHPFFVATLFQPERSALRGVTHPLVCAFVQAQRETL